MHSQRTTPALFSLRLEHSTKDKPLWSQRTTPALFSLRLEQSTKDKPLCGTTPALFSLRLEQSTKDKPLWVRAPTVKNIILIETVIILLGGSLTHVEKGPLCGHLKTYFKILRLCSPKEQHLLFFHSVFCGS
ncbi:hypothetical protein NDU88_005270 [Pleurodeles waltl]|uniref:Uncharacterized protein n=1 Tax=Pleurodeles waltl TaxID=8319 RepID=A0AAV7RNS9_PLEWA|nr:hypothetical protein NDU88_005270 [Pleurodeles waltl]